MYAAAIGLGPLPAPARKTGRPLAREDDAARLKQIRVAGQVLTGLLLVKQAAHLHGVTRQTIHCWVAEALTYPDPEAEALRRLVRSREAAR